jgi:hypothetical protein
MVSDQHAHADRSARVPRSRRGMQVQPRTIAQQLAIAIVQPMTSACAQGSAGDVRGNGCYTPRQEVQ